MKQSRANRSIPSKKKPGIMSCCPGNIAGLMVGFCLLGSSSASAQISPPSISKSFNPSSFAPGATSVLSFTISNPNASTTLTGVAFTDTLPAGMTVANTGNVGQSCTDGSSGLTTTAVPGSGTISFTVATFSPGGSCTVSATVTAPEGIYNNFVQVTSTNGGTGNTATATAIVAFGPALTKTFGAVSILPLGSTSLTFSLTNPNQTLTLNSIAFTDTLPPGLIVTPTTQLTTSCEAAGNVSTNTIALSGLTLLPQATCTLSLGVSSDGTVLGLVTNTTSPVTSTAGPVIVCPVEAPGSFARNVHRDTNGPDCFGDSVSTTDPTGNPASANLFIGEPFQVNYAANLNAGESYVDITNTGTNGDPLQGPGFGAPAGNICVSLYAFDPGEELVSCCSCLVTPGQTVSLGVNASLTSNTQTGVEPTSVTVKLLTTLAGGNGAGTSCSNTAATATSSVIANGTAAFRTTLHATPSTESYATTEAQFTPSTLSAAELASITGRCAGILGNSSGFGICSGCSNGAQAAGRL